MAKEELRLYEMTGELSAIEDELIANGGVLDEELEKRLDKIQLDFQDKALNILNWMRDLSGREDMCNKELQRISSKKKVFTNMQERLNGYLKHNLEASNISKLETGTFTVSVCKTNPSLHIIDEKAIPYDYVETKEVSVINKDKIKQDLKGGTEIAGVELITDKTHLRVR